MADLKLYDLAGADRNVRFSPFCWLAKFGILHKGLDFETVALGFLPKSDYPDADYGKLPMLQDGDELIKDSAEILAHLDRKYPENPMANSDDAIVRSQKIQSWLGEELFPAIGPMMFHRVVNTVTKQDGEYFRKTREERFGTSLEKLASSADLPINVTNALMNLSGILGDDPFLGGNAPDLSDYLAASPLMWKHSITAKHLYETPENIDNWFERVSIFYDHPAMIIHCANC